MNGLDVLELGREAILLLFKLSLPLMLITLVVGLSISVLQTVTQIQEATLTFVPKIVIIFIALYMMLPFMGSLLNDFTVMIADRIVGMP